MENLTDLSSNQLNIINLEYDPAMLSPSIISEEKVEVVRKHQFTFNNSDNMK